MEAFKKLFNILILPVVLVVFVNSANSELDNCPSECICQYAHFMDLSISRWINPIVQLKSSYQKTRNLGDPEILINENEAVYENDDSFLSNAFIKQATCILQADMDPKDLVKQLPLDLQSLVIFYTGEGQNKTVPTSILKPLNQLITLEIRGPLDLTFRLIVDEPLSFLNHANFESIQLIGSEFSKRPKNPVHPRESFDYVPNSERMAYNISLETEQEVEILPYDVYMMELRKTRMATFYGWDNLQVLRIHHCNLDELHWEMFDGLNELQHLSLEHNDIKIIPAFALYGAMHIKTLSLAYNSILDLHYRALAGLLDLEVLDVRHNNLTKLSELTFPPFPKLQYIDFRYNPIRFIFPATFGIMNNTRSMNLGSPEVELMLYNNNPFESLGLLKYLSMENVSISSLDLNVFKGLKSLEIVHIRGAIQRIEFDAFVDMAALRELNLSSCGIREVSMDAFIGCKSLEIVDLSYNNLSYIPPGLFDDQAGLQEVYLNGNNLRYLPSTFFLSPSLKLARLTDNPWKCSCEMMSWNPKITNQERGPRQERCVRDFHSGNVISCRQINNYKFDNKLSPRCTNVKGRSVYYALRKDLKCNFKKDVERRAKQIYGSTGKRGSKFKQLNDRRDRHQNKLQEKKEGYSRATWEHRRKIKIEKTISQLNSIEHLSMHRSTDNNDDTIIGKPEDSISFNYI